MKIPVWACSQERWNSRKNIIIYDDQGSLEYGDGGWTYQGRKQQSAAVTITDVELARPKFAWIAQGIGFAAIIGLVVLVGLLSDDIRFIMFLTMAMSFGVFVGLLVNLLQQWVVVTGEDADGNTVTGRFHDAGAFGWMGILGGNRRLADALEEHRDRGA